MLPGYVDLLQLTERSTLNREVVRSFPPLRQLFRHILDES